jgi:hypothetical protein
MLGCGSLLALGDCCCYGDEGLYGSGVCCWGLSETTFSEATASEVVSEAFSELRLSLGNSPE